MRPFFSYLGSKWQMAKTYGPPEYDVVIEPFAGSAAYSVRWETPRAILFDVNPRIIETWKYLIGASSDDIMSLPLEFDCVNDLDLDDGAKNLIGYWLNRATVEPGKRRGAWAREYRNHKNALVWGVAARKRIADQIGLIKGWEVHLSSFDQCPDLEGTWLIDPPYQIAGKNYTFNSIDYISLSDWCQKRRGQIIACENEGADWLPFRHVKDQRGTFGKNRTGLSREMVWP